MSTFRKVMVTGARSAQEMMRDIDPTINAISETTHGMSEALAPAIKRRRGRPLKLTGPGGTVPASSLAKYNENLERLKMLKAHFDSSYDPLVALLTNMTAANATIPMAGATPAAAAVAPAPPAPAPAPARGAATPPPPEDDDFPLPPPDAVAHVRDKVGKDRSTMTVPKPQDVLDNLMQNLPRKKQKGYQGLMSFMDTNPNLVGVDPHGQVTIRGKVLEGTSFKDIAKAMFNLRKKTDAPTGFSDVLGELRAAGLPADAIASNAARGLFHNPPSRKELTTAATSMTTPTTSRAVVAESTPMVPHETFETPPQGHVSRPKHKSASETARRRSKGPRGRENTSLRAVTPSPTSRHGDQSGSGDLMKMLPGRPVKMLRLYE
jgi:hypothetical protein